MNILAIESSSFAGNVALLQDGQVAENRVMAPDQRSAKHLAPSIKSILNRHSLAPADIALVAVAAGPGSFTGLRVGITTAKTFAYAAGCEVFGVNTLQVIAHAFPGEYARLSVVMDAQRKELFVGEFRKSGDSAIPSQTKPTTIRARAAWIDSLDDRTIVSGPGLKKSSSEIPQSITIAEESSWLPTASSVGMLARALYQAGERCDIWKLVPEYFRKSAAEEKAKH